MIYLCAISNISSGNCSEDCTFCTQSIKHNADIYKYRQKPIHDIIFEAKKAKANKAVGFCLVTAGKGITKRNLQFICDVAKEIKNSVPELNIIACNGLASIEDLKVLKNCGVGSYNHNLETSQSYYSNICTTHTWQERYDTCLNAKRVGLKLCSGGIFGMGENFDDRMSLIESLKELTPDSVAINFFHPNQSLPIKRNNLSKEEALFIISKIREELPNSRIMVAGGREMMFGKDLEAIFKYGANSIVVGDYLTTAGEEPISDIEMINSLGYEIAGSCDG